MAESMRTVNVVFDDEEFDKLKEAKGGRSWHDYVMTLVESEEEGG